METRQCSKCLSIKSILEFYKGRGQCKECVKQRCLKYWIDNKDKNNELRRRDYQKNPEKYREIKRKEYKKDSDKYKKRAKRWRKDNPDKTYKADKKRWLEENKAIAIYLKIDRGGKCCKCGYDKNMCALDWHHRDPNTKDFSISKVRITPKNYQIVISEIEKCDLVCSNCHREIHNSNDTAKLSKNVIERFKKNGINFPENKKTICMRK